MRPSLLLKRPEEAADKACLARGRRFLARSIRRWLPQAAPDVRAEVEAALDTPPGDPRLVALLKDLVIDGRMPKGAM